MRSNFQEINDESILEQEKQIDSISNDAFILSPLDLATIEIFH